MAKLNTRPTHRVIVTTLLFILVGCSDGDGRESPGDKSEWSILQGVEYENRGKIPVGPEFRTVDGYELMSVPSMDRSERIWIMLWPKSPPYYKQMPHGNYELSKNTLNELERQRKISSTVAEALTSHVEVDHLPSAK